jgi:HEAT repeat protein
MTSPTVLEILKGTDFEENLDRLREFPPRKGIQALFSALCTTEGERKWRAVRALGHLVAGLAQKDLEGARNLIRRLLWSLNEESGSMGWGAPEAFGEILARSEALAEEYAPILISYIRRDGNYLEDAVLQRGLMWGIGRLAEANPQLLRSHEVKKCLSSYLKSSDAHVRGLAIRALGLLGGGEDISSLRTFLHDESQISIFEERALKSCRVADLAREAIRRLTENDG